MDQTSFPNRAVKTFSVVTHLFKGIILNIRKSLRSGTFDSMKLSTWDYVIGDTLYTSQCCALHCTMLYTVHWTGNCAVCTELYCILYTELYCTTPFLEGIGTTWVCDQESRKHPSSIDTKPNKKTTAISNLYGSFFSSNTQKQNALYEKVHFIKN